MNIYYLFTSLALVFSPGPAFYKLLVSASLQRQCFSTLLFCFVFSFVALSFPPFLGNTRGGASCRSWARMF